MTPVRPLLVIGTRPEAIKMAPVLAECRERPGIEPVVCLTGQHRELVTPVIEYFQIPVNVELDAMRPNQGLAGLTARCLEGLDAAVARFAPTCLIAQGDTTSVLAASLVAFYRKLPLVHVEAGLRTGNLASPWPEEFNRRVAGLVATLHCAPTIRAAKQLWAEGASRASVRITGNTVIDALLQTLERERENGPFWQAKFHGLGRGPMVLVTGHRRENFGAGFENICRAIAALAARFKDTQFVYPVHLNPRVQEPVRRILGDMPNIQLLPPAAYPEFVWLMDRASLILTDSGGVQEEAPSLGKPVLVLRDTTERPEALDAGMVELVGTSSQQIVSRASFLLTHPAARSPGPLQANPYGDGRAAEHIVNWMVSVASRGWDLNESDFDDRRRAA